MVIKGSGTQIIKYGENKGTINNILPTVKELPPEFIRHSGMTYMVNFQFAPNSKILTKNQPILSYKET